MKYRWIVASYPGVPLGMRLRWIVTVIIITCTLPKKCLFMHVYIHLSIGSMWNYVGGKDWTHTGALSIMCMSPKSKPNVE